MSLSASLVPYSGVEVTAEGLSATTDQPWLELVFAGRIPSGCWIRISYRASYLDDLVRPLIAFETPLGAEWDVMRAALFGRACWIGRVPDRTSRILISPVDRPGPFGFAIEGIAPVSRLSLLARGFRRDPRTAAMALGARLINARHETRQALMFACGGVDMEHYAQWRMAHHRPFEPAGLDAPRRGAGRQPHLRFILGREDGPLTRETPLVASLLASGADHWSLCLPHGADVGGLAGAELAHVWLSPLQMRICRSTISAVGIWWRGWIPPSACPITPPACSPKRPCAMAKPTVFTATRISKAPRGFPYRRS